MGSGVNGADRTRLVLSRPGFRAEQNAVALLFYVGCYRFGFNIRLSILGATKSLGGLTLIRLGLPPRIGWGLMKSVGTPDARSGARPV